MLDFESTCSEQIVETNLVQRVWTLFTALFPEQPLVNIVAQWVRDALRDEIFLRLLAPSFVRTHALGPLFTLGLREAYLAREFDADAVRLDVDSDQVVNDFA